MLVSKNKLGFAKKELWVEKLVKVKKVNKVVKGGKKLSFNAIAVVGDGKGSVGVGIGKSVDSTGAIKSAYENGRKNIIRISLTKTNSISYSIGACFGAAKVFLKPSRLGSGIIAGGSPRIVFEVAGIKNIVAKQLGSKNLLNNARATILALKHLQTLKNSV